MKNNAKRNIKYVHETSVIATDWTNLQQAKQFEHENDCKP